MISDKYGVCQSAQNGPIWKFSDNFLYKSKLKGGLVNVQKCKLINLGPHNAGCFEEIWVSTNRPILGPIKKLSTIFCTKSKLKGGLFYEKNCQLVYMGPHNTGRFEQMRVSADWP